MPRTGCLGPQGDVAAELRRLTSFVGAFECDLDAAIERVENHRDGLAAPKECICLSSKSLKAGMATANHPTGLEATVRLEDKAVSSLSSLNEGSFSSSLTFSSRRILSPVNR